MFVIANIVLQMEVPMPTPLGERVRDIRMKCGLTLEALAAQVGSSKSYMWEIENKDVARPSAEKLHQIAAVLGTTAEYLLSADKVTEAEATDLAFFRKYQSMRPRGKAQLREMLKILDTEDE